MENQNTPQDNIAVTAQPTPQKEDKTIPAPEHRRYAWFAVISLVLCLAAWIVATINGFGAIALGVGSIVFSACALRSHRSIVRNTAITLIIASAVLILVIGAFIYAITLI